MKIATVSLAALLACAAAQPVLAQGTVQGAAAGSPIAHPRLPDPDAIPGYYDPASGRFTPVPEVNTAVTSYNETITFTPKLVFRSAFQNEFTTIRCHLDVDYLSASFASATNDYGPADVISLSVNIAFRSNDPDARITYYLDCTGIDAFDEEHSWQEKLVDAPKSGTVNLSPVIYF